MMGLIKPQLNKNLVFECLGGSQSPTLQIFLKIWPHKAANSLGYCRNLLPCMAKSLEKSEEWVKCQVP